MAWPIRLLTCLERTVSDLIGSCYKKTIAIDAATFPTISLQLPYADHRWTSVVGAKDGTGATATKECPEGMEKSDCWSRYGTVTIFFGNNSLH
jgi:hypothetical protein